MSMLQSPQVEMDKSFMLTHDVSIHTHPTSTYLDGIAAASASNVKHILPLISSRKYSVQSAYSSTLVHHVVVSPPAVLQPSVLQPSVLQCPGQHSLAQLPSSC